MATKLQAGMYLKLLKDITIYDPNTFEPSPARAGSVCKLESISALLLTEGPHVLIICSFSQGNLVFPLTPTSAFDATFEVL